MRTALMGLFVLLSLTELQAQASRGSTADSSRTTAAVTTAGVARAARLTQGECDALRASISLETLGMGSAFDTEADRRRRMNALAGLVREFRDGCGEQAPQAVRLSIWGGFTDWVLRKQREICGGAAGTAAGAVIAEGVLLGSGPFTTVVAAEAVRQSVYNDCMGN